MNISPTTRKWLGLIAIALGVALIVVDTTIVNVIVPSIIEDLGINSVQAQWIQESYAIVFAALLLLVGRVADLVGARRVFIAGVVVFGATSLLAGLAPNGGLLILARFLQGAGAAHDPAHLTVASERDVHRQSPRPGLRSLGFHHRCCFRPRPTARRLACRTCLLALGIRHQHSAC